MHPIPQEVIDAAVAAHHKWGILASITVAQWIQESGWGKHIPPGSNNPFGIKAGKGQPYVTIGTDEIIKGRREHVMANFRKFDSMAQAFDEHARLLAQNPAYKHAREHMVDPRAFANALAGVYATDHYYGTHLCDLMDDNKLYRFDKL